MEEVSDNVCWICLGEEDDNGREHLERPCRCPRMAHAKCLARWQLQSAGKDEERKCRFCSEQLPDWRPILTPVGLKPSTPVVSVHYNGMCYRLRVKPGQEGFEQFRRQLQKITGMPMLECMQITFQCKAPDTAQELSFKGISAFDAAIHCAAVSAAERVSHNGGSSRSKGRSSSSVAPAPPQQQQAPNASEGTNSARTTLRTLSPFSFAGSTPIGSSVGRTSSLELPGYTSGSGGHTGRAGGPSSAHTLRNGSAGAGGDGVAPFSSPAVGGPSAGGRSARAMSLDAGASSSQGVGAGRHHQLSRQHQVPIVETASGCLPHSALMGLDPSMYGGRLGSGVLLGSDEEPDTRVHAHEVTLGGFGKPGEKLVRIRDFFKRLFSSD